MMKIKLDGSFSLMRATCFEEWLNSGFRKFGNYPT